MSSLKSLIRWFDAAAFFRNQGFDVYEPHGEVNIDCPFCGGQHKFYMNAETKVNLCHKCGWAGDLVDFLMEYLDQEVWEVVQFLKESRGRGKRLELERKAAAEEAEEHRIELPPGFTPLTFPITDDNRIFWRYVNKRGILPSVTTSYGLGYCRNGPYRWRVVVPIYWNGTLVNWVARAIKDSVRKSKITPPNNEQSRYLFNLDRLWGREEVVLVEGPFDVLKVPDIAVGSFGKHLSDAQCSLLARAGVKRVVIAYDDDARDGIRVESTNRMKIPAIWQTADRLASRFDVAIAELPPGEDPGSLPESVTKALVREAKPYKPEMALMARAGLLR